MSPALNLIAAERENRTRLGYTDAHDAKHVQGELAAAAICYIVASDPATFDPTGDLVLYTWPFPTMFDPTDDPSDPIRLLVIAGGLIAAEIDRRLAADPVQ